MHLNHAKTYKFVQLKKNQRGSSLVLAIFIIVVMALLGAALLKIMITNEEDYVYEVLGTRAYNAAQTGVQWRLQQIFPLGDEDGDVGMCIDEGLPLTTVDGLKQCRADVTCTSLAHNSVNYFTVTSVGSCKVNDETTSRMIEVQAKSLN